LIDKPAGITSHDVVSRVRRFAGTRRVGHAGTLDPFATGLLVVCVGTATRLVQFLTGLDKEYLATIRFGFATDTQDLTGKQMGPLTASNGLSGGEIEKALSEFIGPQNQLPPMFSAKKVGGQRLYKAARSGREVDRAPSLINVFSICSLPGGAVMNADGTLDWAVTVRCSSGTYVRTLAHDLGARLRVGAHLAALRRTGVGQFRIEQASTLDDLNAGSAAEDTGTGDGATSIRTPFLSPADLVSHLRSRRLDEVDALRIRQGREISSGELADGEIADNVPVALLAEDGNLIAIGRHLATRKAIAPEVVLSAEGK